MYECEQVVCQKVACKRVVYARVACATVVCEKAGLSSDAVEQSGTFDSRKDVNGQCFSVCPARRISP